MRNLITIVVCFALTGGMARAAPCDPSEVREAVRLTGEVSEGERFEAPAGTDKTFVLVPGDFGWTIHVLDPQGDDLSWITPPFHFVPNPRELFGWHFRNRTNTGPNIGDVNAPQRVREFIFDQGSVVGLPLTQRAAVAEGRGVLEIKELSLSPPKSREHARMTTLIFDACLSWPVGWSAAKE